MGKAWERGFLGGALDEVEDEPGTGVRHETAERRRSERQVLNL